MDYNNSPNFHLQDFRSRSSRNPLSPRKLSAGDVMQSERMEEVKDNLKNWAKKETSTRTLSRSFVETVLKKFKWYDPNRDKRGNGTVPDLNEGWAFYEHVTLARHEVNTKGADIVRAAPGEGQKKTELYNYFTTPASSLKDWGVGIALYFSTMRVYGLALLIGGLFSLRNIFYFFSDDYDIQNDRDINLLLRGSAICNSTEWLHCDTGYCELERLKLYGVTYATNTNGSGQTFVQRLKCPVDDTNDNDVLQAGIWNIITLLVFIIITLGFSKFQSRQQKVMDENVITASDYSIRVVK